MVIFIVALGILLSSTHCSNESWVQGRAQQSYQSLQGLFHLVSYFLFSAILWISPLCSLPLIIFSSLGIFFFHLNVLSDCVWELHNADCKLMSTVVREHELQPTISGLHFSYLSSLVIEFDLPWNDEQAATYGDSFRAWADADFQAAIAAVNDACPYNQLAIVVFLILSSFLFLF